jgi:hypothetical protein
VKRALLVVLILAAVTAPSASAHYAPVGKHCGRIVFTPQSDDAASSIRAKRVTCRKARRLVRKFRRGDRTPFRFRCRARQHNANLSHLDVKCTRGRKRVSWAAY